MKRRTVVWLVGLLTVAAIGCDTRFESEGDSSTDLLPVAPSFAMTKSDICHKRDGQGFDLITIADAAYPSHVEHGDAGIGEAVPGMPDYVFGDACEPVAAAACPCFTEADLLVGTIAECGENFPDIPNTAGIKYDDQSVACSGENCASNENLSCALTSANVFVDPISQEEDAACRAAILNVCVNPN